MNALRLEELEQRDLLNAYMAAPPRTSFADHASPKSGLERPSMGHYAMSDPSDGSSSTASSPGDPSPRMNNGGPVVIVETVEIVVFNIRVEPTHTVTYGDGSNSSDAGNVMAEPPSRSVERTPSVSHEAPTDNATPVAVTPATPRAVVPQTTPFAFTPQANPAFAAVQPIAVQLPLALGRTADGLAMAAPVPAPALATPGGGGAPAAVPESAEPPLAPEETPPAAPVLAPLAAVDLSALGRGLGQFLHQIEKVGEELVGDGDGLRPWLIAGAAAATACEIARRQLKRSAEFAPIRINDPRFDRPYIG